MDLFLKKVITQVENPIRRKERVNLIHFFLGSINLDGLENSVDWKALFDLPKDFWVTEVDNIEKYLMDQLNEDLPPEMMKEIQALRQRFGQY